MQNKFVAGTFFFIALIIPVFSAHASIVCVGGFCSDPYNGLLNQSNQLQQQSQSMESQQVQSNQSTINRMKSQYGLAAYSSCTSNMLNVDTANPYTLATWLSYDESCMASYKSTQEQTVSTQCVSLGNGHYSGNCTCGTGYTFNGSVCTPITCDAGYILRDSSCALGSQFCTNKFGPNSVFDGKLCGCSLGYKFNEFFDSRAQCVADTSQQAALGALHPITTVASVPIQTSSPHSSGLSTAQISSIISLLQAFGADASVIASVQVALGQ